MHDPRPRQNGSGKRDRSREAYNPEDMRWVSGFVALVGAWIAVSPVLYAPSEVALWNNVLVGVAIAIVASAGFLLVWDRDVTNVAAASLVALLGIWTILAPLVVGFQEPGLAWSNVGAGAVVALVAGYHAYAIGDGGILERQTRA